MKKTHAVQLGQAMRFRPTVELSRRIADYAAELSELVGEQIGASAAIRELLDRALSEDGPAEAERRGFAEGFVLGLAEARRRTAQLQEKLAAHAEATDYPVPAGAIENAAPEEPGAAKKV